MKPIILDIAHRELDWPEPKQIISPSGIGPSVMRELAEKKMARSIRSLHKDEIEIGILTADSTTNATESPIAIVCEFARMATPLTLNTLHRLAWNFSHSPLLITLEPNLIRAWTCCEPPDEDVEALSKFEVSRIDVDYQNRTLLQKEAARVLHWLELVSGNFLQKNMDRFQRQRCADRSLLANLKFVRKQLLDKGLNEDICHDLLARIIFIQFLFDRKDSSGNAALNEDHLFKLFKDGIMTAPYKNIEEILKNDRDTYKFFRYLNNTFNGDLFPGRGSSERLRQKEWKTEHEQVQQRHLDVLSDFVGGKLLMDRGQLCLWRQYSFDIIPLEFISSIYEEFVRKEDKKSGVVYTPGFLVDLMLDQVLPWNGEEWDLKILDPACGSGIFLVKAYQRLIHRWKKAHPGVKLKARLLRQFLENNLIGIDQDRHAIRVASFSLYLAMCDEIDPKYYWDRVKFPRLRDRNLICSDFFDEYKNAPSADKESDKYDLIIGNAPWGKSTATKHANIWANNNGWETAYKNIGPLFLPKAAGLIKTSGRITLLQPANLIFYTVAPGVQFRKKLFLNFKVDEVINLSALRFGLFKDAISPACIVTMRSISPDGTPISYSCPRPTYTNADNYRIVFEPYNTHMIQPEEAANDPILWTTLMWGGRRDLELVRRLARKINIKRFIDEGILLKRIGINRGDKSKKQSMLINRRILESTDIPQGKFLYLNAKDLPKNDDALTHSKDSTDFSAFQIPQLIVKRSWQTTKKRFQAVIVESDKQTGGIVCSQSYMSVHAKSENITLLESACLSINSKLAIYYLLLIDYRFASYRPEALVDNLLTVPMVEPRPMLLEGLKTHDDVDERVKKLSDLKASDWILVDDMIDFTISDFKEGPRSAGQKITRRSSSETENGEPDLTLYCEYFIKVLQAGFGKNEKITATIFQEYISPCLPVRLVAFHIDKLADKKIRIESIEVDELLSQLKQLNGKVLSRENSSYSTPVYQRVIRVYDYLLFKDLKIPTIFLVKPDRRRYWTRAMALQDADDVAADIFSWGDYFQQC